MKPKECTVFFPNGVAVYVIEKSEDIIELGILGSYELEELEEEGVFEYFAVRLRSYMLCNVMVIDIDNCTAKRSLTI